MKMIMAGKTTATPHRMFLRPQHVDVTPMGTDPSYSVHKKIWPEFTTFTVKRDVPIGEPVSTDPYWKSLRGWENPETVNEFLSFVANVVQGLKSQVDYWITFAEPIASIIIGSGYIAGLWPPGMYLCG